MLKNVWEIENNPVFCFNKEELHLHRRNLNQLEEETAEGRQETDDRMLMIREATDGFGSPGSGLELPECREEAKGESE